MKKVLVVFRCFRHHTLILQSRYKNALKLFSWIMKRRLRRYPLIKRKRGHKTPPKKERKILKKIPPTCGLHMDI